MCLCSVAAVEQGCISSTADAARSLAAEKVTDLQMHVISESSKTNCLLEEWPDCQRYGYLLRLTGSSSPLGCGKVRVSTCQHLGASDKNSRRSRGTVWSRHGRRNLPKSKRDACKRRHWRMEKVWTACLDLVTTRICGRGGVVSNKTRRRRALSTAVFISGWANRSNMERRNETLNGLPRKIRKPG